MNFPTITPPTTFSISSTIEIPLLQVYDIAVFLTMYHATI